MKIIDPYKVEAKDSTGTHKGTWNIYFDQALVVELENGIRYFANLKHSIKENVESQADAMS